MGMPGTARDLALTIAPRSKFARLSDLEVAALGEAIANEAPSTIPASLAALDRLRTTAKNLLCHHETPPC